MQQRIVRIGWTCTAVLCLTALSFAVAGMAPGALAAQPRAAVPGAAAAAAAGPSGYHLIKTIPIPGGQPWDYLHYSVETHQLYIANGDHVDVVDPASGQVVGTIGGMQHIHGIVIAPGFHRGFVTDGAAGKVWIFDTNTLKVTGSAKAAPDADGEVYEPVTRRVFTMNGDSKSSTVIDAATGKVIGTIPLGGQPEFPVADYAGHVYANLESTSQIIEINATTMKIMHRWSIAPGKNPSGLAIDPDHRILFSGCRNNLMAIVDADTGQVITTLPIGSGVDATRFDMATGYAFASNGRSGTLTVIHEDSPTKFHVVENMKTEMGARTMALDPSSHDVYLATAKETPVAHPKPHQRRNKIVPGTFHVLVYARQ